MARIIAGSHKGRRLAAVPGEGTRPTSDRVKESLFSRLEGYNAIDGAVVVDVFAGSGALGFEALSRGARSLEAVDLAEPAYRVLTKNAELFAGSGQVSLHKAQALRYLRGRTGEPIELLFLDPPYDLPEPELTKVLTAAAPQLHEAATVVVERNARSPEPSWPGGVVRFHEKTYGSTRLWLAEPGA
ncbi:16S rRNA (guanine(966)-N(2))-methyltransferase RsmD [Nesterenkonia alkaliphila]|uniref:16S rRNA (Guanine(966)-N(2))-methyltransferase RsmD n=1 Tax=Nesterenkonia alkaliphila TaxID=1463631 RepID=A0A7K1UFX0_9MICC|nr:16S rRNA (guanine(966)-N(2))-methyltransferase RsmD [Nesterenkonia alkaliphila]MVT25357.1 16S rRNA (guanine(966)-N(2))-methyltransferase RsmD [Nesterenkonia alkaliphila]GFZ94316.1 methyltransferase [Nesterenkonia alkaliphila]